MAQIPWNDLMNGGSQGRKRYSGANVRFFNAYNENISKSAEAGRAIFDEIPSISIQFPGGDETVRKIEPQDKAEYADLYSAFSTGSEPVLSGTPLSEWPPLTGSAMRELQHLGFKTVEQLAVTHDEMKRRLGPLSKFVKMAKDWIDAASAPEAEFVALRQQLARELKRTEKLEEQVELLMQRVEANEGTSLRSARREVIRSVEVEDDVEELSGEEILEDEAPRKRGRPKKA